MTVHAPVIGDPSRCQCGATYADLDLDCDYCGEAMPWDLVTCPDDSSDGQAGDDENICPGCLAEIDRTALDRIAGMLAGEWSPDTLTEIDAAVRATGRNPGGE